MKMHKDAGFRYRIMHLCSSANRRKKYHVSAGKRPSLEATGGNIHKYPEYLP